MPTYPVNEGTVLGPVGATAGTDTYVKAQVNTNPLPATEKAWNKSLIEKNASIVTNSGGGSALVDNYVFPTSVYNMVVTLQPQELYKTSIPANITGVVFALGGKTGLSPVGDYVLQFDSAATTLAWGGGVAVVVSSNGTYFLPDSSGITGIYVTVTAASLPIAPIADNVLIASSFKNLSARIDSGSAPLFTQNVANAQVVAPTNAVTNVTQQFTAFNRDSNGKLVDGNAPVNVDGGYENSVKQNYSLT